MEAQLILYLASVMQVIMGMDLHAPHATVAISMVLCYRRVLLEALQIESRASAIMAFLEMG